MVTSSLPAAYWYARAAEARALAKGMNDSILRAQVQHVAESYERLASFRERADRASAEAQGTTGTGGRTGTL